MTEYYCRTCKMWRTGGYSGSDNEDCYLWHHDIDWDSKK